MWSKTRELLFLTSIANALALIGCGDDEVVPPPPIGDRCTVTLEIPVGGEAVVPNCDNEPIQPTEGWTVILESLDGNDSTWSDRVDTDGNVITKAPAGAAVGDRFEYRVTKQRGKKTGEIEYLEYYKLRVMIVASTSPSISSPATAGAGVAFQASVSGEFPADATFEWYILDENNLPISDVIFSAPTASTTDITIPIAGQFTVQVKVMVNNAELASATSAIKVLQPIDPPVIRMSPDPSIEIHETTPVDFSTDPDVDGERVSGYHWSIDPCPFAASEDCSSTKEFWGGKYPQGTYTVSLVIEVGERVSMPGTITFTSTVMPGAPVARVTGVVDADGYAVLDGSMSENAVEYQYIVAYRMGGEQNYIHLETSDPIPDDTWTTTKTLLENTQVVVQLRVWNSVGTEALSQVIGIR